MKTARSDPASRGGERGMTLIAVIFTFIVVAAAVSAMAILFATENRRTIGTRAGAQLRQLLIAVPPFAEAQLQSQAPTARTLTIPTPIPEATLTLTFQPIDESKTDIRVNATINKSFASQTLHYHRTNTIWTLQSTTLHADGSRIPH
ncbi:MAG: hypothetical protein FWD53_04645 [Phycisphaerales bacterium]|nr:hypothetical protein [Phycisphaerales bacterium]